MENGKERKKERHNNKNKEDIPSDYCEERKNWNWKIKMEKTRKKEIKGRKKEKKLQSMESLFRKIIRKDMKQKTKTVKKKKQEETEK